MGDLTPVIPMGDLTPVICSKVSESSSYQTSSRGRVGANECVLSQKNEPLAAGTFRVYPRLDEPVRYVQIFRRYRVVSFVRDARHEMNCSHDI